MSETLTLPISTAPKTFWVKSDGLSGRYLAKLLCLSLVYLNSFVFTEACACRHQVQNRPKRNILNATATRVTTNGQKSQSGRGCAMECRKCSGGLQSSSDARARNRGQLQAVHPGADATRTLRKATSTSWTWLLHWILPPRTLELTFQTEAFLQSR